MRANGQLREQAARLLLEGEHLRSLARRAVRFRRAHFPGARAWAKRSAACARQTFRGETLRWEHREAALEVTLDRGPCNEIGTQTLEEMEALAQYLRNGAGGARALIWRSQRKGGFCAGADLRELYEGIIARRAAKVPLVAQVHELRDFIDRVHAAFDTFDTVPINTIAAVHGVVFGGGWELALTCDAIVADKTARFCFPELRLGLVPGFGGMPRLRRDVGNAVVRDLLLTGRSIRASRAFELGLISQVVSPGKALDVARSVAAQAARFDPTASAAAKAFVKRLPARELSAEKKLFTALFASPVVEEALERFVHSNDPRPYLP